MAQCLGELVHGVAEAEFHGQFLLNAGERGDRVVVHAHADHDQVTVPRRPGHGGGDQARRADALEEVGGGRAGRARWQQRRDGGLLQPELGPAGVGRLPGGVDDPIRAEGFRHRAPVCREVCGQDRTAPAGFQREDHRQTHRSAADHQIRPGVAVGQPRGVQTHGQRLGQRGQRRWHRERDFDGAYRVHGRQGGDAAGKRR